MSLEANMNRTQLLLDDTQDRRLREMAAQRGKSISEIVRQILDEYFYWQDRQAREENLRALQALNHIREETAQHGVYEGDPVNQARQERDAEMEEIWQQWS